VNPYMKMAEDFIKKCVLEQCSKLDSCLRVIICTAAFGMGIDCVGVNCVIHYGSPNDIETYIQQTRRSGRDSRFSNYNSRGSKCNCCDICAHKCNCTKCQSLIKRYEIQMRKYNVKYNSTNVK